jgi:hypothetical protein
MGNIAVDDGALTARAGGRILGCRTAHLEPSGDLSAPVGLSRLLLGDNAVSPSDGLRSSTAQRSLAEVIAHECRRYNPIIPKCHD